MSINVELDTSAATAQAVFVQGHNPHQPFCEPVLLTNPGPASRENTAQCFPEGGEEQSCDPCLKVFIAHVTSNKHWSL